MTQKVYEDVRQLSSNPEGCSKRINDIIDHKCRQLSKTKTGKDSAIHLAEWMKDQLNSTKPSNELNSESWIQEDGSKRNVGTTSTRYEELEASSERNTEGSHQSLSTSESQTTVKSNYQEKTVSVCRQCHKTCLNTNEKHDLEEDIEEGECEDDWGSLMMMGMCGILPAAMRNSRDPFTPAEPPSISVLPPTPDKKIKNTNDARQNCSSYIKCNNLSGSQAGREVSSAGSSSPIIRKLRVKITDLTEGGDDDDTPEESVVSEDLPYKTLQSSGLRRFGTLNSLERVSSDDPLDQDEQAEDSGDSDKDEEDDEGDEKAEVKTHPPEVGDSIRGWTVRAGSFVAAKMAFFERLSSPDNSVTVRKTTFLERYLKPSGENHLDSSPDPGTNTPSSGRGEDEGETSGATSGEEVWGTPTSGGEFEEEGGGEGSALSFLESPRGSVGTDDDTEQLMEDLLISLPMLAARTHGVPPRRRLEPLLEEDDTESSSAPCSPKPLREIKTEQGRGITGSQLQHHDNCPQFGSSENRKELPDRPRPGIIDRSLGIHSDDEEDALGNDTAKSPSFLRRLGLKKNTNKDETGRKCNRLLGFLSGRKVESVSNRNSATYGAKPLFRYLFNKDSDDDIPTTLPRGFSPPRRNDKQLERRFWKQLRRRRSSTVLQSNSPEIAV